MSLPTWTPAALRSEARAFAGAGWRLVEAQHVVSTRRLVDSNAEQAVLEAILEATKPRVPEPCRHLHYLLGTPFRYGRYPGGSRFRREGHTPGVWYGSEKVRSAVAEMVFTRFLFYAEAPGLPPPDRFAEMTAIRARIEVDAALDLTAPPLVTDRALWIDRADYSATQTLSDRAREGDIGLIRYEAVRDPGGINLALLTCAGFARPAPMARQSWRLRIEADAAQAVCDHPRRAIDFNRADFADPRLKAAP